MPRIDEMWCLMMPDTGPDDEGIPAVGVPGMGHLPMVGADRARILSLWELLKTQIPPADIAKIRLLRFSVREDQTELLR